MFIGLINYITKLQKLQLAFAVHVLNIIYSKILSYLFSSTFQEILAAFVVESFPFSFVPLFKTFLHFWFNMILLVDSVFDII